MCCCQGALTTASDDRTASDLLVLAGDAAAAAWSCCSSLGAAGGEGGALACDSNVGRAARMCPLPHAHSRGRSQGKSMAAIRIHVAASCCLGLMRRPCAALCVGECI